MERSIRMHLANTSGGYPATEIGRRQGSPGTTVQDMRMILPHRQNLLLRALSADDRAYIWPRLQRVPLQQGQVLALPGNRITSVHFPEGSITSISEVLGDGNRIAVAMVGREGMTNWDLLIGSNRASRETCVRSGGATALQLAADDLHELCARSPAAHGLLLRFINTVTTQSTRALASLAMHPVLRRLAAWVAMCHDRSESDGISLSHDSISRMLAVRRATVTEAIQLLEGELILTNKRGLIHVRDRAKLEAVAGDAYGAAEASYRELIAPFGKTKEGYGGGSSEHLAGPTLVLGC
jgi:CRP-like cAMP-binding protein